MQNKIATKDALKFILAGNAYFVLINEKTGNRFAYKMVDVDKKPGVYYLSVYHDHTYLGAVNEHGYFPHKPEAKHPFNIAFEWLYKYLSTDPARIPDTVFIYHMGQCGRCGRTLTTPDSIAQGFGPECIKLVSKS